MHFSEMENKKKGLNNKSATSLIFYWMTISLWYFIEWQYLKNVLNSIHYVHHPQDIPLFFSLTVNAKLGVIQGLRHQHCLSLWYCTAEWSVLHQKVPACACGCNESFFHCSIKTAKKKTQIKRHATLAWVKQTISSWVSSILCSEYFNSNLTAS